MGKVDVAVKGMGYLEAKPLVELNNFVPCLSGLKHQAPIPSGSGVVT